MLDTSPLRGMTPIALPRLLVLQRQRLPLRWGSAVPGLSNYVYPFSLINNSCFLQRKAKHGCF